MTVLRRFDYILEPTKSIVLEEFDKLKGKSETIVSAQLRTITVLPFYNLSRLTFNKLLFFDHIMEKASKDERVIQTAMANPLDKFELSIKTIIESLMMQRMAENDGIVTRYMDDSSFQKTIYPILAKEIYRNILEKQE